MGIIQKTFLGTLGLGIGIGAATVLLAKKLAAAPATAGGPAVGADFEQVVSGTERAAEESTEEPGTESEREPAGSEGITREEIEQKLSDAAERIADKVAEKVKVIKENETIDKISDKVVEKVEQIREKHPAEKLADKLMVGLGKLFGDGETEPEVVEVSAEMVESEEQASPEE